MSKSNYIHFTQPILPKFKEISPGLKEILSSRILTKGKYLQEYERRIADYLGVKYTIAVSSATIGLILAEQALGLKGEVILPSFTFSATGHSLIWNNLTPVFVDCDKESFNINTKKIEEKITKRTSAILAVHIFGNPCEVEELEEIAKKHRIKLLFDAAHGLGTLYKGRPLGREGDVSVFSTSPTKLITTGEGGLVTTNNKKIAEKIRIGREYGNPGNYNCQFAGLNGRLGEIQALLGIEGLKMLERNSKRRNRLAKFYQHTLKKLPGIYFQKINPKGRSSYKDFSIVIKTGEFGLSRDELAKILEKKGIETRKYFFPALHQQRAYLCYRKKYMEELSVTNHLAQSILSLPISSVMKKSTIKQICEVISKTHSKCKK